MAESLLQSQAAEEASLQAWLTQQEANRKKKGEENAAIAAETSEEMKKL